jgi:hypothetical protein
MKGSGLDTKKAMELSSQAMQRAADVASIMGISTKDAMTAISGAAKGNFTMMDNLGVSMNATSLSAYALEKGLKKTYAQMSQGEKVELAMQMFMEKTADYAGNYAKENEYRHTVRTGRMDTQEGRVTSTAHFSEYNIQIRDKRADGTSLRPRRQRLFLLSPSEPHC